jgi:thiol-disulfide isomerase/thioredoxin
MPWFRFVEQWWMAVAGAVLCSLALTRASAAPANDNFTNAAVITGITNVQGSNVGATAEPQEPAHADEVPQSSVWWRWTAPSTATFSISTSNSTFDTVLAVYTGATLTELAPVLSNDDFDFGLLWSRVFFRAYAGESFYIAVDGSGGSTGAIQLNVETISKAMTPWQTSTPSGQPLYSSNYAGKVLMIDFWETTCGTCVDELPYLIQLHRALAPQGYTIIGLATDPDPAVVTTFLNEWNVPYPMAMNSPAAENSLAGILGSLANPTKFLVDREGKVVARYPGANSILLYDSAARALLREPAYVRMQISRADTNVTISWPGAPADYRLETTTQFSPPGWAAVNAPVQGVNGTNIVTVPVDSVRRFFRLRKL